MLQNRKTASDLDAFDSGYDAGYRVGYYERRSPSVLLPEQVPSAFDNSDRRRSYIAGWQEGFFKGSRARELNR